jgi:Flp pilus assembly protein TadD
MTTRIHELWAKAKESISRGDWLRARLFMEELTHLLPDDPLMAYNRGLVYWKLEEHQNAEAWLMRALEVKPDFPQALAALKFVRELTGTGSGDSVDLTDAATATAGTTTVATVTSPRAMSDAIPDATEEDSQWLLGGGFWSRT